MQKNIFIILLLGLLLPVQAQDFGGGVSGGLNASRIDGDGDERDGKIGLNVSAFITRELVPHYVNYKMEVKYTSRGKYQGPTDFDPGYYGITIRYVELPIGLVFLPEGELQPEIGLSPDVLLQWFPYDQDGILEPDRTLRRFGLTGFIGVNYFFNDNFGMGVRFNYSAFPFWKGDYYAVRYRDRGWFHDVLSFNLVYNISKL